MFYDDIFIDDSIDKYIDLYNKGISIKNIQPMSNETYQILSKSSSDIKIVSIKDNYALLTRNKKIHHFITTLRKNDIYRAKKNNTESKDTYFYMIPIQTVKGTIVGFILRNILGKKSYASIYKTFESNVHKVPFMYGFFRDFYNFDKHKKCPPIVVCEGAKDCIYLKRFYPFTLANNTSKLGLNADILRNITNKLILVYDNDPTGIPSTLKDRYILKKKGFHIDNIQLHKGIKDPAGYLQYPSLEKEFKKRLLRTIRQLYEVE